MSRILASIGRFIYPLRRTINKLFKTGVVLSRNKHSMSAAKSIYDLKIEGIEGNEIDFGLFRGKKILLVNTASECGFTPQFEGLQKLSEKFKHKLIVVGMPSNDFGAQEPRSENELQNFCQRNYGVTFPLSKKIAVIGDHKHEIFQWLTTKEMNGWNDRDPNWNFCKYLVDEKGNLINFFSHKMDPMDPAIIAKIEEPTHPA